MIDDDILRSLRTLVAFREKKGDRRLSLSPDPLSFELTEAQTDIGNDNRPGQVLEDDEQSPFAIRDLVKRSGRVQIDAFCDGTRSTYFIGYEDNLPIVYTRNAAAVRTRERQTGYHTSLHGVQRQQSLLLAPFSLFDQNVFTIYERLKLFKHRHADLCWTGAEDGASRVSPSRMTQLGSVVWLQQARRRARYLLDQSEQIAALAGARLLREHDPLGRTWLLKDGSFSQFRREYLHRAEPLRNIVSCVKTHPVAYFGGEGERMLRHLTIGQRSVAFLPRPAQQAQKGYSLQQADRPMISWYLRVRQANQHDANPMSGIVRLDIAAIDDWRQWIDEISWAVLDEFHGISAMPDPRHDVMPYGIYDCEQFLKAQDLSGELLLAQLRS